MTAAAPPRSSHRPPGDDGFSPVVGTIMLVGIAIVLAVGLWVFAGGIGGAHVAPPAASFHVTGCSAGTDVSYKLVSSSRALDLGNLRFLLAPDGSSTAAWSASPAASPWTAGSTATIDFAGANLTGGASYVTDIVHLPTGHDLASMRFHC